MGTRTRRPQKHFPDFLPRGRGVPDPHETVRQECARELWSGPLSAEELGRRTAYPPATITLCLFEAPERFGFLADRWYLVAGNGAGGAA